MLLPRLKLGTMLLADRGYELLQSVSLPRPRLRGFDRKERPVPSWAAAVAGRLARQVGHEPDVD
jgi:hypothetical protein